MPLLLILGTAILFLFNVLFSADSNKRVNYTKFLRSHKNKVYNIIVEYCVFQ